VCVNPHGIVQLEMKILINLQVTFNYYYKSIKSCKISSIKINEETKRADVFLKLEEVSSNWSRWTQH
jgi:hypothetical protein